MRSYAELRAMQLRRSDPGWGDWIMERELARMREDPEMLEKCWQSLLKHVQEAPVDDHEFGVWAAGPLESSLAWYGELLIDRIEEEAARNEWLRLALTRVWRIGMPRAIAERVLAIQRSVPGFVDSEQVSEES